MLLVLREPYGMEDFFHFFFFLKGLFFDLLKDPVRIYSQNEIYLNTKSFSFYYYYYHHYIYLDEDAHVPGCICGGEKTIFGSQCSPSTM